jgi:zona occludens toxin (predicted ATPase)
MIELFEGRLGGGKTYNAVVRMVAHVARGGTICTNVEIIWPAVVEYIAKRWGLVVEDDQCIRLTDDQIFTFHRHTPSGTADLPVLVVVDEAHLHFNARDHGTTDRKFRETLTFLTQSRKVNTDIIFISQSILNMDRQFGRLVQYIWRFRDLSKWKIPGLGISYPFQQILCAQYDYDGRTMLNRQFIQKDLRIFDLYDTNSLIRPFVRLEDIKTQRELQKVQKKPLSKMAKWLIPLGVLAGILCAIWLFTSVKNNMGKNPNDLTGSVNTTPTSSTVNRPASAASDNADVERAKMAYDIYAESFQAWNGVNRAMKTSEGGWYQVGEMSTRGYVTAISERRVQVAQPDGRTGWVVANKDFIPAPLISPTPTVAQPPAAGIVTTAPASPPPATETPSPTASKFPITKVR